MAPGSEEYLDSEKYQIRVWDIDRPDSLRGLIAVVNRIRRENPALQSNERLRFHRLDNEQLIAYSKVTRGFFESDFGDRQSGSAEYPERICGSADVSNLVWLRMRPLKWMTC